MTESDKFANDMQRKHFPPKGKTPPPAVVKKAAPKPKAKGKGKPKVPPLFKFQEKAVVLGHEKYNDRVLLGDEMGLGKTRTALESYARYHADKGPLVVVCPAIVKRNWQREASKFIGMHAEVLEGRTPPYNAKSLMGGHKIYIVNYDILGEAVKGQTTASWNRFLRRLKPAMIVADEMHYIKNRKAKRTHYVTQLCKGVKAVMLMSGTPATNRPVELWPSLSILRPDVFTSFKKYAFKFCEPKYSPFGWTFPGATNLDILHRRLKRTCMIRRKTEDVMSELPEMNRIIVPIEPSERDMREYREMEADFIGWLSRTSPLRMAKARKAERLVRMMALKKKCGEVKLPYAHEWIDTVLEDTDSKMIVFGTHKTVVRGSYEKYLKNSVLIDGGVTQDKRQAAVDQFTNDKGTRLLFGNMVAAGVGFNGQAADKVAFLEYGWTPGELAQCEKRAHRIGQKSVVMIYFLVIPGTFEEKLLAVIQDKQKVLDQIFDGEIKESGLESIYDALEDILLQSNRKPKLKH